MSLNFEEASKLLAACGPGSESEKSNANLNDLSEIVAPAAPDGGSASAAAAVRGGVCDDDSGYSSGGMDYDSEDTLVEVTGTVTVSLDSCKFLVTGRC